MRLTLASDVGLVRERNEDAIALNGWALQGQTTNPVELTVSVSAALRVGVCDGMGGHRGGADASRFAAQQITQPRVKDIPEAIQLTSNALVEAGKADPALFGMGTTCVLLEAHADGRAAVFHVGDSRAYLIDPDLAPLTRDDRSDPSTPTLTQALGGPLPTALNVHRRDLELIAGHRLMLCSDGLVDMVAEADIERILKQDASPAPALVAAACAGGGEDNVSVVVVEVLRSPLERLAASDVQL